MAADPLRTAIAARCLRCQVLADPERAQRPIPPAVALFLSETGEAERAVDVYALASRYLFVANSHWFDEIAWRQVRAATASLPPDVLAAARARGRALDWWETVEELLNELDR